MAPLTETNSTRAGRGRSPPSQRLSDAKYGRVSQRPSVVSVVPGRSASSKGGSRPSAVRVLGEKQPTERGRGRSRPTITRPKSVSSNSIPLTTAASKAAAVPDTSIVHIVGDGTVYERKLDLHSRTCADLQRIIAQYTKVPAKLHTFTLGDATLIPERTLYSQGVRDQSELGLTISEFISVIAAGKDGEEVELRFVGLDPNIVLAGKLRRAVAARMQTPFPVSLMNVDGTFIPDSANDMPLSALGVVNGYTLRAIPTNALSPRSKEQATGLTSATPIGNAAYPQTLTVKPKWPLGDSNSTQLFLETDGIWRTGSSSTEHQTSKIPLPPLKSRTSVNHVRAVIFDLLGIQPASQVLFVRSGDPLPQPSSKEARLPISRFLTSGDSLILATDNSWKTRGTAPELPIIDAPASLKLPWCISCIVCDSRQPNKAEWRPQFVQPTWLVEDLISVIALEADSDTTMISVYYRGQELDFSSNLKSQSLNEGSTVLVLIRTVLDLKVSIHLSQGIDRGDTFMTTLRGVPPAAVASEVCKRSLKACGLEDYFTASQFAVSIGGMVVPDSTPLQFCKVSHQVAVRCTQHSPTAASESAVREEYVAPFVPSPAFARGSPSRTSHRPTFVRQSPHSEPRSPIVNWPPPPVQ